MARETPQQRRERLSGYLNDPRARTMLDLIASAEGVEHGYNTLFGNEVIESLADHPRQRRGFRQTDGQRNSTTAAGRYQFLAGTWDDAARAIGAQDFGPENQDLAALYLLERRGALDPVLRGDFQTAVRNAGREWASLPSSPYAQPRRSQEFVDDFVASRGMASASPAPSEAEALEAPAPGTAMAAVSRQQAERDVAVENDLARQVSEILNREIAAATPEDTAPVQAPEAVNQIANQQLAALAAPEQDDWTSALMAGAVDAEAEALRQNALSSFFGDDPVARVQLPSAIEDAINRALGNV